MKVVWRDVRLPDFGQTEEPPEIPTRIYEERCRRAYAQASVDWLVVYGDREHYANLTYLTGFDPRFEEAILLLGPSAQQILVVGNEGLGYTGIAQLPVEVLLCQSFSLMGQDRRLAPRLSDVLASAGIRKGQRVGLVGWKYLEPEEQEGGFTGFFAPAMLVDSLRRVVGDAAALVESTPILMHPTRGIRAINEVEQIAAFEWTSTRASLAVSRVIQGIKPGISEMQAVANMAYTGETLAAHVMLSAARDSVVGLRSPTTRRIERGDAATVGIGYWGGLCSRAGLVQDEDAEYLATVAFPYFRGIATWYQTARLGLAGGTMVTEIEEALKPGGLRSLLNPGHLTSLDEWLHSPMRPDSTEQIASGMAFQCDVIPVPMPLGYTINCEDPVVFADAELRGEMQRRYPLVWSRMQARQQFMRDELGLRIGDELLPLSVMPAYLAPLWLSPSHVLTLD